MFWWGLLGRMNLADLLKSRGPRGPYDKDNKCTEFFAKILSSTERDFRHELRFVRYYIETSSRVISTITSRMNRVTFDAIVELLQQDPIFQSKGRKPQRPVAFQFACFLMRFGSMGADARSAAHKMGIGFGTVFLYCRRVSKALRRLGIRYASWGGVERRERTAENIERDSGFPNCIGLIDGSLVQLSAEPNNSGGSFYCRKGFPAV